MKVPVIVLLSIAGSFSLSIGPVQADGGEDESAKGFSKGYFRGETPAWARGKGYWDGHFKRPICPCTS
jgi:hypothetical protein